MGNSLAPERTHDAEERTHPRGGFAVSEGGLWRRERDGDGRSVVQDGGERADLDGIAEGRSRTVRLHVRDAVRGDVGVGERASNGRLLRGAVWRGERGTPSVLVDERAEHVDPRDGEISAGIQTRDVVIDEDERDARLATRVPVRGGVEGFAPSVRRDHPRDAKHHRRLRRLQEVHAGDARRATGVVVHRPRGHRDARRHQRRRTRGVHRQSGARETVREGDATRRDAQRTPRRGERGYTRAASRQDPLVIHARDPDVHADRNRATAGTGAGDAARARGSKRLGRDGE